jgi:hypothetical protein
LVDQRKLPELQWLQDPCEVNEDNLSNVRLVSKHISSKKGEHLKDKINELKQTVRIRTLETCLMA